MTVPCSNCNTTTSLDVNFEATTFACPNCTAVYKKTGDVRLKLHKNFKPLFF